MQPALVDLDALNRVTLRYCLPTSMQELFGDLWPTAKRDVERMSDAKQQRLAEAITEALSEEG